MNRVLLDPRYRQLSERASDSVFGSTQAIVDTYGLEDDNCYPRWDDGVIWWELQDHRIQSRYQLALSWYKPSQDMLVGDQVRGANPQVRSLGKKLRRFGRQSRIPALAATRLTLSEDKVYDHAAIGAFLMRLPGLVGVWVSEDLLNILAFDWPAKRLRNP